MDCDLCGDDADDEASDHDASYHKARETKKRQKSSKKKEKEICSFEANFEDITTEQVIDCFLSEESTSESEDFLDIVTDTESES